MTAVERLRPRLARRMYTELAALRQRMNATAHVEPTGAETFPPGP